MHLKAFHMQKMGWWYETETERKVSRALGKIIDILTDLFSSSMISDTPLRINNGCQRKEEGKKLLSQSQGSFFWPVTQTWERRKKISNVISHWGAKGRKHFLTWFLKGLWPLSLFYQGIFHCVQKALNIFWKWSTFILFDFDILVWERYI